MKERIHTWTKRANERKENKKEGDKKRRKEEKLNDR